MKATAWKEHREESDDEHKRKNVMFPELNNKDKALLTVLPAISEK